MKIAVLGCGAIGGLFLGYLAAAGKDIRGVVRDYQKEPLSSNGLNSKGVRGERNIQVKVDTRLNELVDLAILASKIQDLKPLVEDNQPFLKKAFLLSTQNGVRADGILSRYFPHDKIITGIVMFGATFSAPSTVIHNFEGDLVVGNLFNKPLTNFSILQKYIEPTFNVRRLEEIKGAKYLKLFINLNNCLPACLGESMQEAFSDLDIARLAIKLNREAYQVVSEAGIKLVSLPTYPKERIEGLVSMDINQAAAVFSKVISGLSREPLYGSILQSIKRGRLSEIDYLNGEIVRLASENNSAAPLNAKIVELVHRVENSRTFMGKGELLAQMEVS